MMSVTVYKLDEYGYRKRSCEVFRADSVKISEADCDVLVVTLWNGSEMRINMNKYDVDINVRAF